MDKINNHKLVILLAYKCMQKLKDYIAKCCSGNGKFRILKRHAEYHFIHTFLWVYYIFQQQINISKNEN